MQANSFWKHLMDGAACVESGSLCCWWSQEVSRRRETSICSHPNLGSHDSSMGTADIYRQFDREADSYVLLMWLFLAAIKGIFPQFLHCCIFIDCCRNLFSMPLCCNGCLFLYQYSSFSFQPSCQCKWDTVSRTRWWITGPLLNISMA
jgi:hypothetical protein